MSLPAVHGIGALIADPRSGETRSGGRWVSALVKFQAWKKQPDDTWAEGDSFVASCIAFDEDVARTLAEFAKGDKVELKGTAKPGIYRDQPQLNIVVNACRVPVKAPKQREPQPA